MLTPIQIMLIEDSPEYRETITLAIERESDIQIASQFGTAEAAFRSFENDSKPTIPSIILLDLNLPGLSGLEAIPLLTQIIPQTQIIVLTQSDREADVVAALSAGATGYLLKDASRQQIFNGIRTVANGGATIDPEVALYMVNALRKSSDTVSQVKPLSKREMEILTMMAEGMVQKEISDYLKISNNTVVTHVRRIYEKLHVQNAPAAVNEAYKKGIF